MVVLTKIYYTIFVLALDILICIKVCESVKSDYFFAIFNGVLAFITGSFLYILWTTNLIVTP